MPLNLLIVTKGARLQHKNQFHVCVDKGDMSHSTAVAAAPSPLRDISFKHPVHKAIHTRINNNK
jgi:hypothetical protein